MSPRSRSIVKAIPAIAVVLIHTACGGEQPSTSPGKDQTPVDNGASGMPSSQAPNITFKTVPAPPRSGDNTVEVIVQQSDGRPVTDVTVSAIFHMPAMPTMNMPEMRSNFILAAQGGGLYRGAGQLVMPGTWNVTVNVARGSEKVATRKFTVIAR